jgi:hypothetical protein
MTRIWRRINERRRKRIKSMKKRSKMKGVIKEEEESVKGKKWRRTLTTSIGVFYDDCDVNHEEETKKRRNGGGWQ